MAEKQHWFSVAQRDLRRRRLWLGRERNCKVFNSRDHEESLVKRCSGARAFALTTSEMSLTVSLPKLGERVKHKFDGVRDRDPSKGRVASASTTPRFGGVGSV